MHGGTLCAQRPLRGLLASVDDHLSMQKSVQPDMRSQPPASVQGPGCILPIRGLVGILR
jgi:hypothetical protein